jgi:4a-hydroxytetrahydrobiopterin dehydratase
MSMVDDTGHAAGPGGNPVGPSGNPVGPSGNPVGPGGGPVGPSGVAADRAADTPGSREALQAWECRHLGRADALDAAATTALLALLPGWAADAGSIVRDYRFADFRTTIAFVNAIAGFADAQDHHPDLVVAYGRCRVAWSTHSAGGITLNDFACAARTDAAFARCGGAQPAPGA